MIKINLQKNRAFVILFAVTISAILLAVALGVANIAFREVRFSTNAQATNNAFFAADTGVECALLYDYSVAVGTSPFGDSGTSPIQCGGGGVTINSTSPTKWNFVISGLGDTRQSCAKVIIDKTDTSKIQIISKGYNIGGDTPDCTSSNPNRVERQLDVTY